MKRRDFTKSLAALFAAPALPLQALTAPSTSLAATSPALPPNLYTWSASIARRKGHVSSDMLMQKLNIDAQHAAELVHRMIRNNVVTQANAVGLSHAKPTLQSQPSLSVKLPEDDQMLHAPSDEVSNDITAIEEIDDHDFAGQDGGETEKTGTLGPAADPA